MCDGFLLSVLFVTYVIFSADEAHESEDDLDTAAEFQSPEQISRELVTLSSLPGTRWKNLLLLDVIKVEH